VEALGNTYQIDRGGVVFGSYVDEPLASAAGSDGPTRTKYLRDKMVTREDALTDNAGTDVERYWYESDL